jgi:hypothetical protein
MYDILDSGLFFGGGGVLLFFSFLFYYGRVVLPVSIFFLIHVGSSFINKTNAVHTTPGDQLL